MTHRSGYVGEEQWLRAKGLLFYTLVPMGFSFGDCGFLSIGWKKVKLTLALISGPIVGLQVRRTDKVGTEAAFHPVEEYMRWVDYWFRIQQYIHDRDSVASPPPPHHTPRKIPKRVFVATDDPSVITELRSKYPTYQIYSNEEAAKTAQLGQRYSDVSLMGVLADIRLLGKCDYLVCTFSSQVCRIGYELMQVNAGDKAEAFHSLDDIYYFGGQFGEHGS